MGRHRSGRELGFGLVEAMIAMVVLAFLSVGITNLMLHASKSQQANATITSRKGLEEHIRRLLLDPKVAEHTRAANPQLVAALDNLCASGDRANQPLKLRNAAGLAVLPQHFSKTFNPCTQGCAFRVISNWGCRPGDFWVDVVTQYRKGLGLPGYDAKGGQVSERIPVDVRVWGRDGSGGNDPNAQPEDKHDKAYLEFYPTGRFKAIGGAVRLSVRRITQSAQCVHTLRMCGREMGVSGSVVIEEDETCTVGFSVSGYCKVEILDLNSDRVFLAKQGRNLWRASIEDRDDWDWNDSVWKFVGTPVD